MIPGTTKRSPAPKAGEPWAPHELTQVMTLLADGLQPVEIAPRLGRSKDSISGAMRVLRERGLIPKNTVRNVWRPEESARVIEMRAAGATLEQMAEEIGRPLESVRSHIQTLRTRGVNVTLPPRPKAVVAPRPVETQPERVERTCLGFECSRKFLAVGRFQRMCEICRAQAKRVCW